MNAELNIAGPKAYFIVQFTKAKNSENFKTSIQS